MVLGASVRELGSMPDGANDFGDEGGIGSS
jgi:hypothetical protein